MKREFRNAFSLLEMLLVISIITILAVFAIPAVSHLGQARHLQQGAQRLSEAMDLARAEAIARNRKIELRLYRFRDAREPQPDAEIRAVRTFLWENSDTVLASTAPLYLPQGIRISDLERWTSLVALPEASASQSEIPHVEGACTYRSIIFHPDGSTNLAYGILHFMTLIPRGASEAPRNYVTLRIDPSTGRTAIFQP